MILLVLTAPLQASAQSDFVVAVTALTNPPTEGDNRFQIEITSQGKPLDPANVSLQASMPAMGTMPRMEEHAEVGKAAPGKFHAAVRLTMAGSWELDVKAGPPGGERSFRYAVTTGIPGVQDKNSAGGNGAALSLGPERLQRLGVRFAEVKTRPMRREVRAVAVAESDKTHREEFTLRYSGYVVKQYRGRVGEQVKAGDPLFSVYSPDLVTAQSEFLESQKIDQGKHSLHLSAAERLKNLGLSQADVQRIRTTGQVMKDLVVHAKASGTILEINAREGAAVEQGQVLYVIGDLTKSYLVARVFQQDLKDLKVGQKAEVRLPDEGEKPYEAEIDLVYPEVQGGTGTGNVRLTLKEAVPGLRPGVYADVRIPIDLGERLTLPTEAVLYSGLHRYVFVDKGEGQLSPVEIVAGKRDGEWTEILSGVRAGDRVASSGTFLLGSEAQLRSALPKWTTEPAR